MRNAVILYGLFRTGEFCSYSFRKHVISTNEVDVFYCGNKFSDLPKKNYNGVLDKNGFIKQNLKNDKEILKNFLLNEELLRKCYGKNIKAWKIHEFSIGDVIKHQIRYNESDILFGLKPE